MTTDKVYELLENLVNTVGGESEFAEIEAEILATLVSTAILGDNDTLALVLNTNAVNGAFVEYRAAMALECVLSTYRDPEYTGGADLEMKNRLLGAAVTNFPTFVQDPTITDPGTLVEELDYGSGKNAGGDTSDTWFWVPPSSSILFLFTSGQNANSVAVRIGARLKKEDAAT